MRLLAGGGRGASHDSVCADCEADPAIAPDLTAACGVSRENRGLSRTHHDSRRRVRDKPRDAPKLNPAVTALLAHIATEARRGVVGTHAHAWASHPPAPKTPANPQT